MRRMAATPSAFDFFARRAAGAVGRYCFGGRNRRVARISVCAAVVLAGLDDAAHRATRQRALLVLFAVAICVRDAIGKLRLQPGVGNLGVAMIVATMLAFQFRLPVLSKLGLLAWAVPVAVVCNFLRTVSICLVAPRAALPYGFVHEAVGFVFYAAGLVLVWLAAEVAARGSRHH
jgi:exosortase/archaeosortase family protein